jgi:hypothetical protein
LPIVFFYYSDPCMDINQIPPKHFYTLDAIRGLAAIVVILYHWQFFYYTNDIWVKGGFEKTALPFYPYLSAIYNDGVIAVDLFFSPFGVHFFLVVCQADCCWENELQ